MEGISLFLPTYNEEENVAFMVSNACRVLDSVAGSHWEVIVVNDGSTDRTREITLELSRREPRVRLVDHGRNLGFGSAVRTGILHSRYPWVFYTDCDGQFDLDELELLWKRRSEADVVSGFRRRRRDPGMRLIYSLGWNVVTLMLFMRGFKDVDASFKLYRRSIFEKVKPLSTSGTVDFEILTLARGMGYRVLQVPVSHYPRRAGTVSFETSRRGFFAFVRFGAIWELWVQLWAFRVRTWRGVR
ncbi:MAG: glycosyltransferase family 2 protein [Candidatus Fermentibacteraceae bacterium]